MEKSNEKPHGSPALRRGVIVLIVLAVLTGIEYFLAVAELPVFLLVLIALAKAAAVLWYFMHVGKLFSADEEGHE
ncbi:MAG TPA: cytochrome C oxidase subunit IV family protein [Anaerolineaceae bacterium]|nr:cytochrome C oxidase subunit IV family protein [Anaerolineaceae bacterium]